MRPPITVTNVDKHGKVTNKWHVRVGNRWQTFNQAKWAKDGLSWIQNQLKQHAKKGSK
jgi:hypothetical protein